MNKLVPTMSSIAPTAKIYPNVRLGAGVRIDDWAVVGLPAAGASPWDMETIIGDGAVIRSHTTIYGGSRIGPRFQTGHRAVVGPCMDIGAGCSIGTSSVTSGFAKLHDGARIHSVCFVDYFAAVQEDAWVGPSAIVESRLDKVTVVGAGAILALKVHLFPGIRVGERALIGTRSVLRKDIPPYRLVIGNPPRAVRTIDQIVSPIADIGRPYKPDPPDVQEANFARHTLRYGCELSANDWRVEMWDRLHAVEAAVAESDWTLGPALEQGTAVDVA